MSRDQTEALQPAQFSPSVSSVSSASSSSSSSSLSTDLEQAVGEEVCRDRLNEDAYKERQSIARDRLNEDGACREEQSNTKDRLKKDMAYREGQSNTRDCLNEHGPYREGYSKGKDRLKEGIGNHLNEETSSSDGEDVDWKERYETLEASLHRFKQQASRIRELLAVKMQDLEKRTQAAEQRSEEAEEKAAFLEQKLASVNGEPVERDEIIKRLQESCNEKDEVILEMRQSLEVQKQLRFEDGCKVEERTSTIKDWVAKKVKNLESENTHLKLHNDNLSQQVDTLRVRLQLLPVSEAREIHRLSIQGSDDSLYASSSRTSSIHSPLAPPVPKRPSTSVLETFHLEQNVEGPNSCSPEVSPDLDDNLALCDEFEPDYQEVDDNRESKYEPAVSRPPLTQAAPPIVRIERRVFPQYRASTRSSVGVGDDFFQDGPLSARTKLLPANQALTDTPNGNIEGLDLVRSREVTENKTLGGQAQSKGRGCGLVKHEVSRETQRGHKGGGRKKHQQNNDDEKRKSDLSGSQSPEYAEPPPPVCSEFTRPLPPGPHKQSPPVLLSHYARPPAVRSATGAPRSPTGPDRGTADPVHSIDDEEQVVSHSSSRSQAGHVYPCTRRLGYNSRNIPAFATMPRRKRPQYTDKNTSSKETYDSHYTQPSHHHRPSSFTRSYSERRPKPPTPPLRRLPSWENRIYAVANIGLQLPEAGNEEVRHSGIAVTEDLYAGHIYKDLLVPVYTTLKGRATRIRSMPFTGESSSDSDEDGQPSSGGGVVMVTSSEGEAAVSVAGPSGGRSLNNSAVVKVRRHLGQSPSGAIKRGVSSHSITSDSSSDYALPPEEVSTKQESSGDSEPEEKLLKYATGRRSQTGALERSGYLTKLGGKVKSWRRRWFVLKGMQLFYYKSANEVAKKPQGFITIDNHSKVMKTDGALTFQISTVKKTYYLTAECAEDMDQWIQVLQSVLRRQAAQQAMGTATGQEVVKGWIIKGKNGRTRRCFAVVVGKHFMYYRSPEDKTPLGQLPLQGARVEEVDRSCDSDSDDGALPDYTLVIWAKNRLPTYLMVASKHEKDTWLYHLSVASGGHLGTVGTEFEQLVSKLLEGDGDPTSSYWKHPALLHTRELLPHPLTTLPSEGLQTRALELFKSCQMFINMSIESSQIDYHVTLAQNILNTCLQIRELQNELYCQLLKQSSWHPPQQKSAVQTLLCGSHSWLLCSDHSPTTPDNSPIDILDSKLNPAPYVFIQTWQLLAMATSLFLPSQCFLWYLKAHLQRHADPRTEIGKYAVFCQRAVERARASSPREARPSRMEVLSILLRNPYHHSQPISIPVHFINGTYQVLSFDGSTTVDEFSQSLTKTVGLRSGRYSGFALFTDDPAGQALEHCLRGNLQVCDVISQWEQAFLHHATQRSGKVDINRTVRFTYKNRLYFKSQRGEETPKERLLLCYQIHQEICEGRFPLNRDLAMELSALMAQIEFGDQSLSTKVPPKEIYTQTSQQQTGVLDRFYPRRYRDGTPSQDRLIEAQFSDKWRALHSRSVEECVRIYLTVVRKWPFCGARLFSVQVKFAEPGVGKAWLAVQEGGVGVLDSVSLKCSSYFTYKEVVTFGGCHDDLMLVVSTHQHTKTERLLFEMSRPKMLEFTMVMASYINNGAQLPWQQQKQHDMVVTSGDGDYHFYCDVPSYHSGDMYVSNSVQV